MLIGVEAGIKGEPVAPLVARGAKSSHVMPDGGHMGKESRLVQVSCRRDLPKRERRVKEKQ